MVRRAPPRILPANCISHLARPRSRRWNTWLQQRELQVDDLCEDVKPGAMCVNLIEVLSGSLAAKHHATPKTKYQMLENQGVFLDMLRSKGIRLVNIGNEAPNKDAQRRRIVRMIGKHLSLTPSACRISLYRPMSMMIVH